MDKPVYPCIHYSELEPFSELHPLCGEWEFYRREVDRLIAEGHERKFVLSKGNEIVGFFDTVRDAHREGLKRFGVYSPYLIRQILTYERVYKSGAIVGNLANPAVNTIQQSMATRTPLAKSA